MSLEVIAFYCFAFHFLFNLSLGFALEEAVSVSVDSEELERGGVANVEEKELKLLSDCWSFWLYAIWSSVWRTLQ